MRRQLDITEGIFPMPVLMVATYNEDGTVNVMNAAWGTMQERDAVALNLTETQKTVKNIKARGAFTVSLADAACVAEADYFGVVSGNNSPDKFANSGLTSFKSEVVDAPVINELPLCLECRFVEYQSNEYGCGVIGKVIKVTADDSVMKDGKLNMALVNAIVFCSLPPHADDTGSLQYAQLMRCLRGGKDAPFPRWRLCSLSSASFRG